MWSNSVPMPALSKARSNTNGLSRYQVGLELGLGSGCSTNGSCRCRTQRDPEDQEDDFFFLCNLGQDLASVNRSVTPWVIAMWHTPWYTSNAHHPMSEGTNMRLAMEDLLHTHEVGVAFNARTLTRT